jgi:hypothetical protein
MIPGRAVPPDRVSRPFVDEDEDAARQRRLANQPQIEGTGEIRKQWLATTQHGQMRGEAVHVDAPSVREGLHEPSTPATPMSLPGCCLSCTILSAGDPVASREFGHSARVSVPFDGSM